MTDSLIKNGLAVIHSNQLESLAEVVQYWLSEHPLPPLENEVFLVNNNGMGHWSKQSLAQNQALGIAAGIDVVLPSSFIWRVYRQVLGEKIPQEQPLAKAGLVWRLYRLLPELVTEKGFENLARFLADDQSSRKRYQLAEQLADLFDQYQVYRSDWLADWAAGHDVLADGHGVSQPLPEAQRWQALLWRAILADLGDANSAVASRASVHAEFMVRVDHSQPKLPKRVIVFGLSSLPQQSLEVLVKIAQFCQVVLFINNPCQHYWADIIEDKELLKAAHRRQNYKAERTHDLSLDDLHQQANPLLAAWGKQGRDYIRLLDQFDEKSTYQDWGWPNDKIDLFQDYAQPGQRSLLQQVQQSILDLEALPGQAYLLDRPDQSLEFHVAHSRQREVEILHDQLLSRFNAAEKAGQPLHPRDVIVMVPDVNSYAPHINAVFGQIKTADKRYIPFSLADQSQRGQNPLLNAVEALLTLPESRFAVSDCLALLEVPALRKRFAIDESAVPKLQRWIHESGIRWGLNQAHRQTSVAMPDEITANTWEFGLQRMLLGYAVGAGQSFNGIEPYVEIGGLDAQWLGSLAGLQEKLEMYRHQLSQQHSVDDWCSRLQQLLEDFFIATHDQERKTLAILNQSLMQWQAHCKLGDLSADEWLPVQIVREAWLSRVDEPNLQQRFLSGRVNFCTLMPMRAIPFRLVCILGMNDGDYPRSHQPQSFDLMSQRGHYRPGDRSRRQDDQYLFLEALLSAREQLYISWIGRSIRDNSERPPSVLVSQLRDFVVRGWQLSGHDKHWLKTITVEHPLQPFSQDYIKTGRDERLFTYSKEWFETDCAKRGAEGVLNNSIDLPTTVSIEDLGRFLKAPVKTFCQSTLKFSFDDDAASSEDNEPFEFNRLESHVHTNQLLAGIKNHPAESLDSVLQQEYSRMVAKGMLPLAGFSKLTFDGLSAGVTSAWQRYQTLLAAWPTELAAHSIVLDLVSKQGVVKLTGDLVGLHQNTTGEKAVIVVVPQSLAKDKKISYHRLMTDWVRHLAACADGFLIRTFVIAADDVLEIAPLAIEDAKAALNELLSALHYGLQMPIPVAVKTAFTWLAENAEKKESDARIKYEGTESGGDWSKGEVDYDAYLKRFFPDFDSLNPGRPDDKTSFDYWANQLYQTAFTEIQIAKGAQA
jgi:exodeoxyribonuclease V gamma subunit